MYDVSFVSDTRSNPVELTSCITLPTLQDLFTFPQSVGIAGGRPSSSYYFLGYQADSLFYLDPHHTRPAVPLHPPPYRTDLEEEVILCEVSGNDSGSEAASDPSLHLPRPHPDHPARSQPLPPISPHVDDEGEPLSSSLSLDALSLWYTTAYSPQALQTFHCDKVRRMGFNQLDPSMLLGFLCKDEADWEDFVSRVAKVQLCFPCHESCVCLTRRTLAYALS